MLRCSWILCVFVYIYWERYLLTEQFALIFCRALGLIVFLPLDSIISGYGIKMALTFFLACGAYDFLDVRNAVTPIDFLNEFMSGFAQAFPLILLLHAIEMLGDAIEVLRGQTIGSVLDPLLQNENAVLPVLLRWLLWTIIIQLGVVDQIVVNFVDSVNQSFFDLDFWKQTFLVCLPILSSGFSCALLFAFTVLTIQIGMMFTAKLLPNVEIESVGFIVRSSFCFVALITILKVNLIPNLILIFQRALYG